MRRAMRCGWRDAAIDVDQVGEDVEGEERNAERQRELPAAAGATRRTAEHVIDVADEEARVI